MQELPKSRDQNIQRHRISTAGHLLNRSVIHGAIGPANMVKSCFEPHFDEFIQLTIGLMFASVPLFMMVEELNDTSSKRNPD